MNNILPKKNDWVALILNQPEMDFQDFANFDVTPDNTNMNTREYYKEVPIIKDAFTENGKFNETKFENFYTSALNMYNVFSELEFENKILDSYEYDMFDYFAPMNSRVQDSTPVFRRINNWEGRSSGLSNNLRGISRPTKSAREVAQGLSVIDYETGEDLGWTPEDKGGFFKGLFRPTVVLSTWDEDGSHIIHGREIFHQKGDLKFDSKGMPRYETLGNRSINGKQVLAYGDTLTREGTWINKYDFIDSDGISKSATGTVSKLVFSVAPFLIPRVNAVYGGITAAMVLSQFVPSLMKSINAVIGGDNENNRFINKLSAIEAATSRFNNSVSDYSQNKLITLENLGALVYQISSQLYQQRVIAELPRLLNSGIVTRNVQKTGRALSLAYMSGTSSREVYDEFKEAGASDRVAGLGMLASIGAMYGLMSNNYFRDMLFRGTYLDESDIKYIAKDLVKYAEKEIIESTGNITQPMAANFLARWANRVQKEGIKKAMQKTAELAEKAGAGISRNVMLSRSINEALEEVSEEMSQDLVKALFAGASALGINMSDYDNKLEFNVDLNEIAQRYAMNFFGGAIGGPIFELHGRWHNNISPTTNRIARDSKNDQMFQELVYAIRDGKAEQLREDLYSRYVKGKIGNPNLSATNGEIINDGTVDKLVFAPATSGDSQNDAIYRQAIDVIDRVENLLSFEGLKLTDAEIKRLSLDMDREKLNDAQKAYRMYYAIAEKLIDDGIVSRVFQDINDLGVKMIETHAKINNLSRPNGLETPTPEPTTPRAVEEREQVLNNSVDMQRLQRQLTEYRAKRDNILKGQRSNYYFGQALFVRDASVHKGFLDITLPDYTLSLFGKSFNALDTETQEIVRENWKEYQALDVKNRAFEAFDLFLALNENISSLLKNLKGRDMGYMPGNIHASEIANIDPIIESLRQELTKLTPEANAQRIAEITTQIKNLEEMKAVYDANIGLYLHPKLDPQTEQMVGGFNFIDGKVIDDEALHNYAQGLLEFYKYTRDKEMYIDNSDADVNVVVNAMNSEGELWKAVSLFIDEYNSMDDSANYNGYFDFLSSWGDEEFTILEESGITRVTTHTDGTRSYDETEQRRLIELLGKINSNLGRNNQNALKYWNEMINQLKSLKFTDRMISDLTDRITPMVNNQTLIEYLNEYYRLRAENSISPVYSILDRFSLLLNGKELTLVSLLKSQEAGFQELNSLDNYLIENNMVLEELKSISSLLEMMASILSASVTVENEDGLKQGFNHLMNIKREQWGEELLPEMDLNQAMVLQSDVMRIQNKVDFLLTLAERNKNQKLRVNRNIAINIKQRMLNDFLSDNKKIKSKFNEQFNVNLDELWEPYKVVGEINDTNFGDFEVALINFETAVFKAVNAQPLSSVQKAVRLLNVIDNTNLYKQISTKLSSTQEIISDYDMLVYLATIIAYPSSNFHSNVRRVIEDTDRYGKDKAPIFTQEYAARIGYTMAQDPELFNYLIDNLLDLNSKSGKDPYFVNYSKLYNFYLSLGGAGSGKTTGVGLLLYLMLKSNSVIVTAPKNNQRDKLADAIKYNGKQKFNKAEFFEKILGKQINPDDLVYNDDIHHLTLKNKYITLQTNDLFNDDDQRVLFIDEISFFNEPELKLISDWAVKNNVMVIAFGDLKQNGIKTNALIQTKGSTSENKSLVSGGIEDTYHIKSPNLVMTMRSNNIGKVLNYNEINTILEDVFEEYAQNPGMHIGEVSKLVSDKLNVIGLTFKYFETENAFFGEKFVDSDDAISSIRTKLDGKGSIAIITDNDTKYRGLNNVTIIHSDAVQGEEFDYVIVDKQWDVNSLISMRDLYTMTQRSASGTIIKTNNLLHSLPRVESKVDDTIGTSVVLNPDEINIEREKRVSLLKRVGELVDFQSNAPGRTEAETKEMEEATKTQLQNTIPITEPNNNSQDVNKVTISNEQLNNLEKEETPISQTQQRITNDPIIDEQQEIQQEHSQSVLPINSIKANEQLTTTVTQNPREESFKSLKQEFVNTQDASFVNHNTYFNFVVNQLFEYDKNEKNVNSLYNKLGLTGNVSRRDYINIIMWLGGLYKFGHINDRIKRNLLEVQLRDFADKKNIPLNKINGVLDNITKFEYHIISHNNGKQGLLISRIPYIDGFIDIPLLITSPDFGRYNGEITVVKRASFEEGIGVNKNIETLNNDGLFNIHERLIVISVDVAKDDIRHNPQLVKWLSPKDSNDPEKRGNNGKTFVLFTDDPYVTYDEFKMGQNPTLDTENNVVYLISNNSKVSLMGAQRNLLLSQLTKESRSLVSVLLSNLDAVPKTEIKNEETDNARQNKLKIFNMADNDNVQVLHYLRTEQVLTALIDLARTNSDINRTLFRNLQSFVSNKLFDKAANQNQSNVLVTIAIVPDLVSGKNKEVEYTIRKTRDINTQTDIYELREVKTQRVIQKTTNIGEESLYSLINQVAKTHNIDISKSIDPKSMRFRLGHVDNSFRLFKLKGNRTIDIITDGMSIDQVALLDEQFVTPLFKNGIYANDPINHNEKIGNYTYNPIHQNGIYRTDATQYIGSWFKLDNDQIIKSENVPTIENSVITFTEDVSTIENVKTKPAIDEMINEFTEKVQVNINRMSQALLNNKLKIDLSQFSSLKATSVKEQNNIIKSAFDYVNKTLADTQKGLYSYRMSEYAVIMKELNEQSIRNFIKNQLGNNNVVYDDIIEIIRQRSLKFIPFLVSLSEQTKGYYLSNLSGQWELFNFNSFEQYKQLNDFASNNIKQLNELYGESIANYVKSLLTESTVENNDALAYYSTIQNNLGDELLVQLNTLVNNYLLERIKNNEC